MKGGSTHSPGCCGPRGQTVFRPDVLREEMDAWADELDGPVVLGWAPGFLGDQRDKITAELSDLVDADRLRIGHPRQMLRALRTRSPRASTTTGSTTRSSDVVETVALEVTVTAPWPLQPAVRRGAGGPALPAAIHGRGHVGRGRRGWSRVDPSTSSR